MLTITDNLAVSAALKDARAGRLVERETVARVLSILGSDTTRRERFVSATVDAYAKRVNSGKRLNGQQLEAMRLIAPAAAADYEAARSKKSVARSAADRVAAFVARHSVCERRACADPERRARLEQDPKEWLRYYLANTYYRGFDKPHLDIIDGVMSAYTHGGRFAVAAERGIGKSSLLYGLVLFLKLTGRRHFPVYLPWSAPIMKRGLQFWRMALSFNARLLEDYPEYCAPFAQARGTSQRLSSMRWSDTNEPCGALLQVSDGMIVMPDGKGVIGGSTVNGNPRGLNLPQQDGSILRPDLALVDDPQDREVSKSSTLTGETVAKIDQDIAGLGEAGADFPMLVSGNCISAGDVMDHYLNDTNWNALRVSCVEQWPDGWDDNGPAHALWATWWDLYRDNPEKATEFYGSHRPQMVANMVLSAPNAYQNSVRATLPDIYCVAMKQYWRMGRKAFMAERQQRPTSSEELAPFSISVKLICSRADPARKPFELPEYARSITVAGTDINHYGLHSAMVGFGNDSTAACAWWGKYDHQTVPRDASDAARKSIIYSMLTEHGRQIRACQLRPDAWVIDGGYEIETVMRYVKNGEGRDMPFRIYVARGFSEDRYKPYGKWVIGEPRDHVHLTEWPSGRGLAFSADYWREIMQRAWLADIGQPGGMSTYGDPRELAEHICRERLLEKVQGNTGTFYKWATLPGKHDLGDGLVMCYVGAAYERGIGPGSVLPAQQRTGPRRERVSVISI
jgi:hypothetical protein